jgi:hypothetical protein
MLPTTTTTQTSSSSSLQTAEGSPHYGLSDAVVCLDFYANVPMLPRDCLLGQRAISKAQIAREGSNVKVIRHVRQNLEHSYKELFVDVTGKLPSFARAILPSFVLYMENCVDYPTNTATLACIKPNRLRGTSAFSETVYCNVGEIPQFSIEIPSNTALPYSQTLIDYQTGWKQALPINKRPPILGVVHKRFLLDVGANGIFWRRLRNFLLKKFQEAFVDMLREVELCVRSWGNSEDNHNNGTIDGKTLAAGNETIIVTRPRFESAFSMEIAPKPRLWPRDGLDLKTRAAKLANEFAEYCKLELEEQVHKENRRERVVSASFFLPE